MAEKNSMKLPHRDYWLGFKARNEKLWEDIRDNAVVNMFFPLREVSKGNTEALLPMIVPGGNVAREIAQLSNLSKAEQILAKDLQAAGKEIKSVDELLDYLFAILDQLKNSGNTVVKTGDTYYLLNKDNIDVLGALLLLRNADNTFTPLWVENFTKKTEQPIKGVGRILYDAAITDGKVIRSGAMVNDPAIISILKYYPKKKLVGNYGTYGALVQRPVWDLTEVSNLYEAIPIETVDLSKIKLQKRGGKMNILDYLKEGSQIHIKKKNRGKFTDYCGGKVTAECIARGKKSPSATIRKRATFAANARKWNHEDGGILKALDGIQFLSLNRTDLKRLNETDEEWKNRVNAIINAGNIDIDDTETPETVGPTASSSDGTTSTTTDWTTQYRATGGNETSTTSPQQTTTQTSVATAKPDMSKVRSDRNNNPLNIRFTNIAWLGKKTEGKSDNDFEEFESRDYGWRAAYKNIETKMKRGLNTITKLVSEWAPPSENNTNGYIQFVALKTGIDPNAVITRADLPKIGAAMAAVESGRRDNIDWDDAMRGFKFYLGQPV